MCPKSSLGVMLPVLVVLAGCGSAADSLINRHTREMNNLAAALESGKKESDLKAIDDRIDAALRELDELNLSVDEKKALGNAHAKSLGQAMKRLAAAAVDRAGPAPTLLYDDLKDRAQEALEAMAGKMESGFSSERQEVIDDLPLFHEQVRVLRQFREEWNRTR